MSNKLYIGNLSHDLTEAEMQTFFSSYGTVLTVLIKRDSVTGEPWGYGFIEMEDAAGAAAVVKDANGKQLGENRIKIDPMRYS